MHTTTLRHQLNCNYTGVALGVLDLTVTAGHIPYMSHWNEMVCYHPLFSLTQNKLCEHMRNEWNRLAKLIADETATELETQNLKVGFVALLHCLDSIRQDRGSIGLPALETVQTNLESLINLNYWQSYLASKKFHFPLLHISKLNDNAALTDVKDYLDVCWEQKRNYEQGINEAEELERSKIAERAIIAIKESWIRPTGKKLLWMYCCGYLQKYPADRDNWMRQIFLSTSNTITAWEMDDIELMEEIIFSNIPVGNTVSYAVRERVNEIKAAHSLHYDAFQIEESVGEFMDGLKEELAQTPRPEEKDYPSKAAFFVARAKWDIAHPNTANIKAATVTSNLIDAARVRMDNTNNSNKDNGL